MGVGPPLALLSVTTRDASLVLYKNSLGPPLCADPMGLNPTSVSLLGVGRRGCGCLYLFLHPPSSRWASQLQAEHQVCCVPCLCSEYLRSCRFRDLLLLYVKFHFLRAETSLALCSLDFTPVSLYLPSLAGKTFSVPLLLILLHHNHIWGWIGVCLFPWQRRSLPTAALPCGASAGDASGSLTFLWGVSGAG